VTLMEHLHEWAASSDEWSEMVELQDRFNAVDSTERVAVGGRIAELLESYADRMERSGAVRWFSSSLSPDSLRASAAVWRTGTDPNE
jgi:hypothetical protein